MSGAFPPPVANTLNNFQRTIANARTRADVCLPMQADPHQIPREVLAGLVERVTFHNKESGFCVLWTKARGQRDLVTVIGQAASISAAEWITAKRGMDQRRHRIDRLGSNHAGLTAF